MSLPIRNGTYSAINHTGFLCQPCSTRDIKIFKRVPYCAKCKRNFKESEFDYLDSLNWHSRNDFRFKGNGRTPIKPMPAVINGLARVKNLPLQKGKRTLSTIEQEQEALKARLQELQEEKRHVAADSPGLFSMRLLRVLQALSVFVRNHEESELLKKYRVTPNDLEAMRFVMKIIPPKIEHTTSKEKGMTEVEWMKREEEKIAARTARLNRIKKHFTIKKANQ